MIYNELEAQVLGAIHERLVDLPLYLEWGLKTEHFLTPEYKEIFQKMTRKLHPHPLKYIPSNILLRSLFTL